MSPAEDRQSSSTKPNVPRWRAHLVRLVLPTLFGFFVGQLLNELPQVAVGAVVLVMAVVHGFNQLDATAPLAEALPHILLYAALAGIALAVATPDSWTGPITLASVVLILCATLIAPDRATALTSLAGIGIITSGVIVVSGAMQIQRIDGRIGAVAMGVLGVLLGLVVLWYRRVIFGEGGVTTAMLRQFKIWWSRTGAGALIVVLAAVELARDGRQLVAALVATAGLAWVAAAVVFVFTERHGDAFAGAMLAVCGASVTGLGLVAFYSGEFLGGIVATAAGVAMAGGGLSLLRSTGVLLQLQRCLTYLIRPATPGDPPMVR